MDKVAANNSHDEPASWELSGSKARFACGELRGALDVTAPARGLAELTYRGAPIDGWLLGVVVNTAPSDAYVRGGDLVVSYREADERPFSVQVYWSIAESSRLSALILDATISIQTRQWEAYPEVGVSSSIGIAPHASGQVRLLRPASGDWTYAELAPAEDFAADLAVGGSPLATAWLFDEQFMERGVIRRLRVRGAIIPREDDEAHSQRIRETLLVEQPPLTA